jgi:voltage-gated potassium channel Kch
MLSDPRPRRDRFERRAERAIANRHVVRYLSGATIVLVAGAAFLVWLVDRRDFATLGDALWWSVQTLTTVGYGDIVPHTTWGRVVGSAVMVLGLTFLSILTATVTSYFVAADQGARMAEVEARRGEEAAGDDAVMQEILERLSAIETAVREREPRED